MIYLLERENITIRFLGGDSYIVLSLYPWNVDYPGTPLESIVKIKCYCKTIIQKNQNIYDTLGYESNGNNYKDA